MSCNPTRILLSNSGATTMNVTVSPDPGDGVSVTFQVDGLTISDAEPTSSGTAVFSIATVVAVNNSLWDATLQIGSNTPVEAEVQVVESNGSQTIGVTLTDSEVTYCSPTSTGGGGSGTVTEVTGVTPISVANGTTTPEVSLDNAGITTAKIADDAVTSPKIADDAVTHGKIADLAVEHGKIGLGAVQTTNINDDAVTADKLADTAVTPGSYTTADITVDAQGRITSASTGSPPAGTVTSVTAGSGLTGGTITSSGTIAHGPGTFIGSEEYPVKIVVDSFGHIQVNESESTAADYRNAVGANDAANLTTGVLDVARVPDLDAAKIATGTIAAARLPAVADAYTGQIETADDKTYTIDPGVVAARSITQFYARSGAGTCTATLKNDTATVGVISVTTSSTTALISNTSVAADDPITLVISSNSSATDVVFSVEFTQ